MVLRTVEIVVEEEPEGEMAMCAEGDGATRAGGEPVGSRLSETLDAEAAIVDLSCHEMVAHYSLNIFSEIPFYRLSLYISYL